MSILILRSVVSSSLLYARSPKVSKEINHQLSTRSFSPHWLPFTLSRSSASVSHGPTHTVLASNGGTRPNNTSNRRRPSLCLWFRHHRWHCLSIFASRVVYRDEWNQDSKRSSSEQTTRSRLKDVKFGSGSQTTLSKSVCTSKSLAFELQTLFILYASVVRSFLESKVIAFGICKG